MALPRPCIKCQKTFQPTSRYHRVCYGCMEKINKNRLINKKLKILINEKPHQCKECGEKFRWKRTLITHISQAHGMGRRKNY